MSKTKNLIQRGVIERTDDSTRSTSLQVSYSALSVEDDVEYVQPFGVAFRPPVGASVVSVALNGDREDLAVLGVVDADSRPRNNSDEGTGGLYYAGAYRVFLDAQGNVHLGAQVGEDYVALSQLVMDNFNTLKSAIADAAVGSSDGGAAFKANIIANLESADFPVSVAATKVKAT